MSLLAPIAAAKVLARRKALAELGSWGQLCGFSPNALHHRFLIRKLEAAVRGEGKRRIGLFLPPGAAKTTWGNKLFIPWFLGQGPGRSIISVSHNDEKAEKESKFSRNLIKEHSQVLGYSLRTDSKAVGYWETTNGGSFFCGGAGKGIAGYRAGFGLVDDPYGKKEDAMSKVVRERIKDWYHADFCYRLTPGAVIFLIMTRWNDSDLAAHIEETEAHLWEFITIPLIAKEGDPLGRSPGDPLWPEYFTPEHITELQASPDYEAMCQQNPIPETGEFFKREWIIDSAYHSRADLPDSLRYYVGSDHAVSQREESDRTCLIPAGVDATGDLWILPEVWWTLGQRPTPDTVVDEMIRLCRLYRVHTWWAGRDHITASLKPFIDKRSMEEKVFVPFEELSEARDKQTKAQPIRAMFKLGRVHLPAFAPWFSDALNELLRFDRGKHDDFVDALAKLGRGLGEQVGGTSRTEQREVLSPPPVTLGWVKAEHARLQRKEDLAGVGY